MGRMILRALEGKRARFWLGRSVAWITMLKDIGDRADRLVMQGESHEPLKSATGK